MHININPDQLLVIVQRSRVKVTLEMNSEREEGERRQQSRAEEGFYFYCRMEERRRKLEKGG